MGLMSTYNAVYGRTPERDQKFEAIVRRSDIISQSDKANIWQKLKTPAIADYTGMFKLELQTKKGEVIEGSEEAPPDEYYLNITWPDSNYTDTTVVGIFNGDRIQWSKPEKVAEDIDVYLDPFSRQILLCGKSDLVFSTYILLGNYSNRNHAVTQVVKIVSGELSYTGYTGQFLLAATKDGAYVVNGIQKLPASSSGTCGTAYINNVSFGVSNYAGARPESDTYYYIRHTVAQTAAEGDEDEDLSDSEKEALRKEIAGYDTAIKESTDKIAGYQKNISDLYNQITVQNNKITTINNKYNSLIDAANKTYNAEVQKVNTQINALDPSDENYQSKKEQLEQQLVTLSKNLEAQIKGYEQNRTSELNAVYSELSKLSSDIANERSNIATENSKITTAANSKNTACLKLYGAIPTSAKCEIFAQPPSFNTSQTDQYIYYPIGAVTVKTVGGVTTYTIIQTHQIGNVQVYRMGNSCAGFPE